MYEGMKEGWGGLPWVFGVVLAVLLVVGILIGMGLKAAFADDGPPERWLVTVVVLCPPVIEHCITETPGRHTIPSVFQLPPAATQDACRLQAFDHIFGSMRRKGTLYPFDVECELKERA